MRNLAKKGILLFTVLLLVSEGAFARYHPVKKISLKGAYYFSPAVAGGKVCAFGYMSKIVPSVEEIRAEKERIRRIIDNAIREGYGEWKNFNRVAKEVGKKVSKVKAPCWVKGLLPPLLVKRAIPLLLKGALLYAVRHPESLREPIGRVGETGVVVVDENGNVYKIPLGINAPVASMAFSSDHRWLAVLTDMSFEDATGKFYPLGEISLIEIPKRKVVRRWIFGNLASTVAFSPDSRFLAFDAYANPRNLGNVGVYFISTIDWKLVDLSFPSERGRSGCVFGKTVHYPSFRFSYDGLVATQGHGRIVLFSLRRGKKVWDVPGTIGDMAFAHSHPWMFTAPGIVWNYRAKKKLLRIRLRFKHYFVEESVFSKDDNYLYYLEGAFLTKYSTNGRRVVAVTPNRESLGGLFFLGPMERYAFSFYSGKGMVTYKGRYLRRRKLCLKVIRLADLRVLQKICIPASTVLDASVAGETLFVSDFERIHMYE